MLQDVLTCGVNGWLGAAMISAAGFLVALTLLLAIAVLVRYLLGESRQAGPNTR